MRYTLFDVTGISSTQWIVHFSPDFSFRYQYDIANDDSKTDTWLEKAKQRTVLFSDAPIPPNLLK